MNRSIRKCIILFILVIAVISVLCLGLSEKVAIFTSIDEVVSEKVLIPGGQSVGIQMNVKGVLVVGLEEIETEDSILNPGLAAGIQVGDMITAINNTEVDEPKDVQKLITNEENQVTIYVNRKGKLMNFQVTPARDHSDGKYKLGIWVKEKIAGIGTMTFYDPESGTFAALGHGIYEPETGTLLAVKKGKLLKTAVKSVKNGEIGKPGEIRGIIYADSIELGSLKKNTEFGIYGNVGEGIHNVEFKEPMVAGNQDTIELGKAYILTTIDGEKIEKFDIEIEKINYQTKANGRGLEIKVVDKRLLESCGGIVQGMSGSPIIQNNRIIGAITHVFVNNPQKGYGIFVEWMVENNNKQ